MYWKIEEAREELERRQRNSELTARIDEFLKDCPIPPGLNAFLARHIASARLEDLEFERRAQEIGLEPIWLEYPEDIFVSNNPSKVRLIKLLVCEGYGKKGEPRMKVIHLLECKGTRMIRRPFVQILTKWGEPLIAFHRRIRVMTGLNGEIIDLSPWLKSIGPARQYYRYLLAASLTRGVLFESFESPGFPDLDRFTETVVWPAWEWVAREFGFSPLIVKHPNTNSAEEEEKILNWYPPVVLEAIPKD